MSTKVGDFTSNFGKRQRFSLTKPVIQRLVDGYHCHKPGLCIDVRAPVWALYHRSRALIYGTMDSSIYHAKYYTKSADNVPLVL